MFAEMRTGSNLLEANLNALDGVTCHGEAFNPHFIGYPNRDGMFDMDLAARERDPGELLRRMKDQTPGLPGFRYFHDHDARVCDLVLFDPACAKIILTRNPLESYVSWKIAQATNQWKLTNAKNLKTAKAVFDAAEFAAHVAELQAFQRRLMHGLQTSGQTAFYIDYEDLQDLEVLNGLAAFLGVEARLAAPDGTLKKQNPEEVAEKVTNPREMEAALARTDWFNLGRTPNFEPRRSPNIVSLVAAREAPLLYLPIKAGPERQVLDWLAQLGGVERGFDQRKLRQWKKDRPQHRSFTVVRHPVARAKAAFDEALDRAKPDLRQVIRRSWGVDIGDAATIRSSAGGYRTGFLAFAKFLKTCAAGQSSLKVEAAWATQAACLQGFAGVQSPDAVLREERLAEGLGWLAAELGLAPPALRLRPEAAAVALEDIYDAEVEAAVHEAQARDYIAFGFEAWRA